MIWSEAEMFKEEHDLIKKFKNQYDPDRYRKHGAKKVRFTACHSDKL